MEDTSFPAKGEKCVHPASCWQRHQRIKQQFQRIQDHVERELQEFVDGQGWKGKVRPSYHAEMRMRDRAISLANVYQLIETGYAIACEGDREARALMSRIRVAKGLYRTVHVLYRLDNGIMHIITLYEPMHSSYLYDAALESRICWCAGHPSDFD